MAIAHEIRRSRDGHNFVLYIYGQLTGRHLEVPLSVNLSGKIQEIVDIEGIKPAELILPPRAMMNVRS